MLKVHESVDTGKYHSLLAQLIENFDIRFSDFTKQKDSIILFSNSKVVEPENSPCTGFLTR